MNGIRGTIIINIMIVIIIEGIAFLACVLPVLGTVSDVKVDSRF